jgi:hypothetical protein
MNGNERRERVAEMISTCTEEVTKSRASMCSVVSSCDAATYLRSVPVLADSCIQRLRKARASNNLEYFVHLVSMITHVSRNNKSKDVPPGSTYVILLYRSTITEQYSRVSRNKTADDDVPSN